MDQDVRHDDVDQNEFSRLHRYAVKPDDDAMVSTTIMVSHMMPSANHTPMKIVGSARGDDAAEQIRRCYASHLDQLQSTVPMRGAERTA